MDLQRAIATMAAERGWSDTTVQILLCRFLEDNGMYNKVMDYLDKVADEEEHFGNG